MEFKTIACSTVAVAALTLSASASAAVVNFDQSNGQSPTGTISYDGGGGALSGSNIAFNEVRLNNASAPAGNQSQLNCSGCAIDFSSGDSTSEGPAVWRFGGGGNFTLSGAAVDDSGTTVANGDLFSGTVTTATVTQTSDSGFNVVVSGTDDFNDALAAYYGIDESSQFNFSNTEIALGSATFDDNGGFISSDLQNADVTAKPQASPVPAPQELGLFGLGVAMLLAGLGVRRKNGGMSV